jgi:hypothetical protein
MSIVNVPPVPENQPGNRKLVRILGGGLAALFFGFLIAALSFFGVIPMTLGHICLLLAWLVGTVLISTQIIPGRPVRHKRWMSAGLGTILLVLDIGIVELKKSGPASTPRPSADFSHWSVSGTKLLLGHTTAQDFKSGSFTLDMSQLLPFAKDYLFIIIARVEDNSVEALTDTRIEKSQAFTITNEVRTIQINLSDEFAIRAEAAARKSRQVSIQYYFAVIPKDVQPEQIHTITDITSLGGSQMKSNVTPNFYVPPAKP